MTRSSFGSVVVGAFRSQRRLIPRCDSLRLSRGLKANVEGSRYVLEASWSTGVERYVNTSTDEATDPINTLGRTKSEAELLTAADATSDGRYLSVRFGTVLGPNGSIIPTFLEQLRNGMPITVTDPDVTRLLIPMSHATS